VKNYKKLKNTWSGPSATPDHPEFNPQEETLNCTPLVWFKFCHSM
jgi:hypothetical protein